MNHDGPKNRPRLSCVGREQTDAIHQCAWPYATGSDSRLGPDAPHAHPPPAAHQNAEGKHCGWSHSSGLVHDTVTGRRCARARVFVCEARRAKVFPDARLSKHQPQIGWRGEATQHRSDGYNWVQMASTATRPYVSVNNCDWRGAELSALPDASRFITH